MRTRNSGVLLLLSLQTTVWAEQEETVLPPKVTPLDFELPNTTTLNEEELHVDDDDDLVNAAPVQHKQETNSKDSLQLVEEEYLERQEELVEDTTNPVLDDTFEEPMPVDVVDSFKDDEALDDETLDKDEALDDEAFDETIPLTEEETKTTTKLRQPKLDDITSQEVYTEPTRNEPSSDDDFDDRTVLDLFGEMAKDYLTKQVIPPTDADCRFDWRSLRCEPSCTCQHLYQHGDYHLGRSCRRRHPEPQDECEPSIFFVDRPLPKRLISLIQQTTMIAKNTLSHKAEVISQHLVAQYQSVQASVCENLWTLLDSDKLCWTRRPRTTLMERVFCRQQFPSCESRETSMAYLLQKLESEAVV